MLSFYRKKPYGKRCDSRRPLKPRLKTGLLPAEWRLLYSVNPMVGVIDGFRWAILGTGTLHWPSFLLSLVIALALLASGLWYFRKTERSFADVI